MAPTDSTLILVGIKTIKYLQSTRRIHFFSLHFKHIFIKAKLLKEAIQQITCAVETC